jgi:uncharacterized membrane protein (UPF0127 family)
MPMASPVADLPTRRSVRTLLVTVVAAVIVTSACGPDPAQPAPVTAVTTPDGTSHMSGLIPEGFETMGLRIIPADGEVDETQREDIDMCVWTAITPAQRSRGLMGVNDLGGKDGMAFIYAEDRTTSFTMRNTLIDLSIAFFDADGTFMDAFDMEPCSEEPCPSYPTPIGFRLALEVPAGDLGRWGIGPGSIAFPQPHCDTP